MKLKTGVDDYVAMKQALGFSFFDQKMALYTFLRFMEKKEKEVITTDLAVEWAKSSGKQKWYWAKRLSILRNFARYWQTIDPRTEVWAQRLMPFRYQRVKPYIYK